MPAKPEQVAENVIPVDDDGWETLVEEYGETWNPDEPGTELIGVFTGRKTIDFPDEDEPNGTRQVDVYEVKDQSGKKWSVWSSYNIDLAFEQCRPGDTVRLVFVGKENLDRGKTVKKYRISRKSGS